MPSKLLLLCLAAVYIYFYPDSPTNPIPEIIAIIILPTNIPLRTIYTRIPIVEKLTPLLVSPLPINDDLALDLHALSVRGSLLAAWALSTLEAYRAGEDYSL